MKRKKASNAISNTPQILYQQRSPGRQNLDGTHNYGRNYAAAERRSAIGCTEPISVLKQLRNADSLRDLHVYHRAYIEPARLSRRGVVERDGYLALCARYELGLEQDLVGPDPI